MKKDKVIVTKFKKTLKEVNKKMKDISKLVNNEYLEDSDIHYGHIGDLKKVYADLVDIELFLKNENR